MIVNPVSATAIRVYRAAPLNSPSNANAQVPMDTVEFATGGMALSGGGIAVPVPGIYLFHGVFTLVGAGGNTAVQAMLFLNGAQKDSGNYFTTGGNIGAVVDDILELNAGDVVALWMYTSGLNNMATGGNTFLAGAKQ